MPNLVDYYTELNISKESSLEEINAELTKLKRVWIQREINQPEKARKMLTLIDDACEVFKTEATKAKYNRDLEDITPELEHRKSGYVERKRRPYQGNVVRIA